MQRNRTPLSSALRSAAAAMALLGGLVLATTPRPASAQTRVVSKTCSACGQPIPLSSRAGQSCPHCGAYWSDERVTQVYREPEPVQDNEVSLPRLRRALRAFRRAAAAQHQAPNAQRRRNKWCMTCGGSVAPESHVGQICPYCGIRWSWADPYYTPTLTARRRSPAPAVGGGSSNSSWSPDPRFYQQLNDLSNQNTMRVYDQMTQNQLHQAATPPPYIPPPTPPSYTPPPPPPYMPPVYTPPPFH